MQPLTENTARHCRQKILSETLETQDTKKLYDVLGAPTKLLSFGEGEELYVCDGEMMNFDIELFTSFLILVSFFSLELFLSTICLTSDRYSPNKHT